MRSILYQPWFSLKCNCLTVSIFLHWLHMGNLATWESSPSIMIYSPANSNWHWLALIGMGLEWPSTRGKAEVDLSRPPSLVTMVTAWCNNRWCWHFWLMSRHWWMTAVTHVAHRWQPGNRDDIISVGQILGYDEGKAVWVCLFVFACASAR